VSTVVPLADLRCEVCAAAEPEVISPGYDAEMAADLFAIGRPAPTRAWCLVCALEIGWPWPSEALKPGNKPITPAQGT
jgi:hypothetical protein